MFMMIIQILKLTATEEQQRRLAWNYNKLHGDYSSANLPTFVRSRTKAVTCARQ